LNRDVQANTLNILDRRESGDVCALSCAGINEVAIGSELFGNQATDAGAGASDQHCVLRLLGASVCGWEQRRHN
jgi:transcriptional regulator of aromatic amino acid metabolism